MPTKTPHTTIHYPPTTLADLRGLAAQGNAAHIHEFSHETVGLATCPGSKRNVTIDAGLTEKQIAQDLLAYFYAQGLDGPCGSAVFAYHNQSEVENGYTVGRVITNVTDASGGTNMDKNAKNVKRTLTLNVGGFDANKESVVTY